MSNNKNEFIEWLDALEKAKGYSDYEVAKLGVFSHSVISRARAGTPPGWEVCAKIAKVFEVSPITAFRKAGLLPPGPEDEVTWEDWRHLLAQMTPAELEEMREIGIMKLGRRKKKEEPLKSLKPKKAG